VPHLLKALPVLAKFNGGAPDSPDHNRNWDRLKRAWDESGANLARYTPEVYNVKGFRAVGNGLSDDTLAIQMAIDAAYNAGGGSVYVPPGNYIVSSSITLKYRVNLVGAGDKNNNASRISAASGMFSPVLVNDQVNGTVIGTGEDGNSQRINSSSVRHLAIINRQVSHDADAVRLTNCWTFDFFDCYIQSYYGFAFRLLDCNALHILNCFHNASFAHSLADSEIWGCQAGPSGQPSLDNDYVSSIWWFNGSGAWKNLVASNFIFNAANGRTVTFTASAGNPVITATGHGYASGTPVMLETTGTLPGSLVTTNVPAWVTRVDADTLKLSSTRPNYLAGTFLTPADAGVGTHTFRVGGKGNLFLSNGAQRNTFVNNRFDQAYWDGVRLHSADKNLFVGNTVHENGRANATGCAGFGLYDSDDNSITGNAIDGTVTVTATGTSNQDYGVYGDATSHRTLVVGNTMTNHATADVYDGDTTTLIVSQSRVVLPNTEDVSLAGLTGTLIVGGDGSGQHIAVDGNEIMSKAGPTTAGTLNLQAQGGNVSVGGGLTTENTPEAVSVNAGTNGGANDKDAAVAWSRGGTSQWLGGVLGNSSGATSDWTLYDDVGNVTKLRVVQGATGLATVSAPLAADYYRCEVNTPAQITGNQDNYDPGQYGWLRLSTDASRNITGFTGGAEGRELWLTNVGSFNIVLVEQATSTAANQIITGTGANVTMAPLDCALLKYDNASSRWRIVGYY